MLYLCSYTIFCMSNNPENPTINDIFTSLFQQKIKVFNVNPRYGIDPSKYFELTFLRRLQILFSPSTDTEFIDAFKLLDVLNGQSLDSKTLEISKDVALKIFRTFAIPFTEDSTNDSEFEQYFDSVYRPESNLLALEFLESVGIEPVEN